jgi:hypothetical protein
MISTHSGRLERWLGAGRIENLSKSMQGWYGPPIPLLDCPGGVRICGDGDFIGPFERGVFWSALDSLKAAFDRASKVPPGTLYTGFASISDALSRASGGYRQTIPFYKVGATGVASVTSSLYRKDTVPPLGSAPGNAPDGTAFANTNTGAMGLSDAVAGSLHLTGADVMASVVNNSLLLYDLIFGVNKTMASTDAEAVTGVPTRYQSTTFGEDNYCGGNFVFPQVGGTALASTAHNWTTCTYFSQADTAATFPSLTGVASAIVDRLDMAAGMWFMPLATGDIGVKKITQIQCSASVATGVLWFMMGHPLGIMSIPIINTWFPFDWLTNKDQAPRIFNGAFLALLELTKPATTATTYAGYVYVTEASA